MKKALLFAAVLLLSAAAEAQIWVSVPSAWVRMDGGNPASAGSLPLAPTLGDMIYYDGAAWVSRPVGAHANGEVLTLTLGIPDWGATAASGYATVQDEGVALTQFTTLNCVGAGIVCSNGASKTTITVGAAAGAVLLQGAYPGTPDTGNANVTGTYGSTQNNVHATISNFGLSLENNQAALVGQTREYSPGIRFVSSAWDTDGAVSNTNSWQVFGRPLNGNTTSVDLVFYASLAGGAYSQKMALDSAGLLTLGEAAVSAGGVKLLNATSGSITISPVAGALGTQTLTAPAETGTLLTTASTTTKNIMLYPSRAQFLATAFPQYVVFAGTNFPVESLKYDTTTEEAAFWQFEAEGYASGNLTLTVYWYADTSVTAAATVEWEASITAITGDADTTNVETDTLATSSVQSDTLGTTDAQKLQITTITISNLDSIAAGDLVFLRLSRNVGGTDDMAGDAQVIAAKLSYLATF